MCPYRGPTYIDMNNETESTIPTYTIKVESLSFIINTFRSSISTSFGECRTIIIDPKTHKKHPSFPRRFNRSLRNFDAITAATKTDNAPSGVTNDAGANAYAAKLKNKKKVLCRVDANQMELRSAFHSLIS